MQEMGISFWDYDDGSVGAHIDAAPEGEIWAKDTTIFFASFYALMATLVKIEEEAQAEAKRTGTQPVRQGLEMHLGQLPGEPVKYGLTWDVFPNFGVFFDRQEQIRPWLTALVHFAIEANQGDRKPKTIH